MPKILYWLLLAAPLALVGDFFSLPPLFTFTCSALALVPLAGIIGESTEELSEHIGHVLGGLLNATFGNAPELVIGIMALRASLPDVVRASIIGSILGNLLLVFGTSLLVGGFVHRVQVFQARVATEFASLLVLAVIGYILPTLTGAGIGIKLSGQSQNSLSLIISIALLAVYAAYILFAVFGVKSSYSQKIVPVDPDLVNDLPDKGKNVWLAALILGVATVATAVFSEILVGSITPVTHQVGWSVAFVGIIIVPIVGNAAEHSSAIRVALHNKLDICLGISAGSASQVALLVGPLLILASYIPAFSPTPLTLAFSPLQVTIFAFATILYAFIVSDGESNWLEGFELLMFYIMVAAVFYVFPVA